MNRREFFSRKIESFLKLLEIFLPVHPFIQNESDFKRYARILQVSNKRPLKFLRKILKFSLQYLESLYVLCYSIVYTSQKWESLNFFTHRLYFMHRHSIFYDVYSLAIKVKYAIASNFDRHFCFKGFSFYQDECFCDIHKIL